MALNLAGASWPALLAAGTFIALAVAGLATALFKLEFGKAARRRRRLREALGREGYAGWIIAALVGAFSMATHFGAYWLIAGGGWLGAALVTLCSTVVM